jgi:hypothetical protein
VRAGKGHGNARRADVRAGMQADTIRLHVK